MRFKAKYVLKIATGKDGVVVAENAREITCFPVVYFRTIDADTETEANNLAKKYTRKGYMLASLMQQLGKE